MTTATYTDPVLDSLRRFDDPSQWVVIHRVPVFDEHDEAEVGTDGRERVVHYGLAELTEIAANCNRRGQETGDWPPITCGHVLRDRYDDAGNLIWKAPENQQPDDFGVVRDFVVGRFGPAQKLAVLGDFWYRADSWEEAKKYRRRSVDFWAKERLFDPIAVLKRRPRRDLGVMQFDRHSKVRQYEMDETTFPEGTMSNAPDQPRQFSLDDRERAIQMTMSGEATSYEVAVAQVKSLPPSTPWRNITSTVLPPAAPADGAMTLQERDAVLKVCELRQCSFEDGIKQYRASTAATTAK